MKLTYLHEALGFEYSSMYVPGLPIPSGADSGPASYHGSQGLVPTADVTPPKPKSTKLVIRRKKSKRKANER